MMAMMAMMAMMMTMMTAEMKIKESNGKWC